MRVYTQSVEAEKTTGGEEKSRHPFRSESSSRFFSSATEPGDRPSFAPPPSPFPFVREKKEKRRKKQKGGKETREEKNKRGNRWPNERTQRIIRYSDDRRIPREKSSRETLASPTLYIMNARFRELLATCIFRYSL